MNQGASRLAPRPAARVPGSIAAQTRRDRDALRRERMAAPLALPPAGSARPQNRNRARSRPAARHRQALTAWGVLLMVTGATTAAATLEAMVIGDVHWFFDLVFIAASFHAATLVRRRDLLAGVIVPPLAYCAGLLTAVQFGVMRAGHGLVGQLASLGTLLAVKPRPLFLGTGLAAVLIAARWVGTRSAARR